jgi:hypothetical protein
MLLHFVKSTLPYYWANEEMNDKMELFQEQKEQYNLVYFGPSAVRREFIPYEFESKLRKSEIRAFNFGTAGVYYAEQTYLIRNALEDSAFSNVEYILSYGQKPKEIVDDHFHKLRMKYCLDWSTYSFSVKYFFDKGNLQQVYRYTIMFLENQLFVGEIFDMVEWHFSEYKTQTELRENAGYVPYEWSVSQSKKSTNQHDKFLAKHEGKEFMPGYRKKPSRKKSDFKLSSADERLVDHMIDLQNRAETEGVSLTTVFKPNMNEYLDADSLNAIYFGDGRDYQSYFKLDHRWDHKHLNEAGAIVHSQQLARLFEHEYFDRKIKNSKRSKKNESSKKQDSKKKKKGNSKKGKKKGDKKKKKGKKKGGKNKKAS